MSLNKECPVTYDVEAVSALRSSIREMRWMSALALILLVTVAMISAIHYHSWSNRPNEIKCEPVGYIDQYAPFDLPRPKGK